MCNLSDYSQLTISEGHRVLLNRELPYWHRFYLPIKPDGTVFDLGAGCGETAFFYLKHGAESVVSVEFDPNAAEMFMKNFPKAKFVKVEPGDVVLIQAKVGTMKIDVEGAEEDMVVENHFNFHWKHLHGGIISMWRLVRSRGPLKYFTRSFFWIQLYRSKRFLDNRLRRKSS